jgi:hypothetical protein
VTVTKTKVCKVCLKRKPKDRFYTQPRNSDGLAGKCKDCQKEAVKIARVLNAEHYKEYDKRRANRPDRVVAREAYAKTEQGRAVHTRATETYVLLNPEKRKAHNAVNNALRDGKLQKGTCEVCGSEKVHAHHDDYSKPLEVRWFCSAHHQHHHQQEKKK